MTMKDAFATLTGANRDEILVGDGRTFAQVTTDRLSDDAEAPADLPDRDAAPGTDAAPEHAQKRKTAA
jgi:hypothetical protein